MEILVLVLSVLAVIVPAMYPTDVEPFENALASVFKGLFKGLLWLACWAGVIALFIFQPLIGILLIIVLLLLP